MLSWVVHDTQSGNIFREKDGKTYSNAGERIANNHKGVIFASKVSVLKSACNSIISYSRTAVSEKVSTFWVRKYCDPGWGWGCFEPPYFGLNVLPFELPGARHGVSHFWYTCSVGIDILFIKLTFYMVTARATAFIFDSLTDVLEKVS